MNKNTDSKESYELVIKSLETAPSSLILAQTFEHNQPGLYAAFELMADIKTQMNGLMISALIISSRDDVIYDEEFNVITL